MKIEKRLKFDGEELGCLNSTIFLLSRVLCELKDIDDLSLVTNRTILKDAINLFVEMYKNKGISWEENK